MAFFPPAQSSPCLEKKLKVVKKNRYEVSMIQGQGTRRARKFPVLTRWRVPLQGTFVRAYIIYFMLLKMATNISGIPVVDFSAMSLQNESSVRENSDAVKQLADHVHQAFSTIGFVYLKNHGIPQEKVAYKYG